MSLTPAVEPICSGSLSGSAVVAVIDARGSDVGSDDRSKARDEVLRLLITRTSQSVLSAFR